MYNIIRHEHSLKNIAFSGGGGGSDPCATALQPSVCEAHNIIKHVGNLIFQTTSRPQTRRIQMAYT